MSKIIMMSLLAMSFGFFAQAQDNPCANDVQTLCPGIEPGEGRVMKCMHDNMAKLSPECKARHEKMKKAMKEVKAACHDDFDKFCSDVKPGGGRVHKCMKEHKDELSQGCKDEMEKMHKKHKKG